MRIRRPPNSMFELRRTLKLTQAQVARVSGVSLGAIHRLEHGRIAGMRLRSLLRIADALDVAVTDLVPGLAVRLPL